MTATLSCSFHRTAGFRAGSIPMIGMEGYCCLSVEAATLVAVLQAMTIAFHILCEKKIGTLLRSLKNSLSGLCSVRCVCRIAKIYIIFTGHELHDVAENAYSAEP